jgi:hypothetical protein
MRLNIFLVLLAFTLLSCNRKDELAPRSTLSVRIPSTQALAASNATGSFSFGTSSSFSSYSTPGFSTFSGSGGGDSFNVLLNPTSLSGFDCFAVMVGGGTYNQKGICTTSDGQSFTLGAAVGGVPAGQSISFPDVPSGNRTLVLIGFNVQAASDCRDFFNQPLPNQRLSQPHVLAKLDQVLQPGNVSVNITAAYSTKKITSCQFADSNGGKTGYYGTGYDGDVTLSAATNDLSTIDSVSFPGRKLLSIMRINEINSVATPAEPDLTQVVLNTAWSSANLGVGDEVMLYVVASGGTTACGPNVYPGFSTSAFVTSYDNSQTFQLHLHDSRFLTIPNAQLQASASGASQPDFCRVLAIRVPHFNNLTITNAAANIRPHSSQVIDLTSATNSNAGIMILRVAGQLLASGAVTGFNVDGGGFKGGDSTNNQGHGVGGLITGAASPFSSLENGGGRTTSFGGGGGHGGIGGRAGYNGMTVGDQYGCPGGAYDATMKCLTGKFFAGGGGGFGSSVGTGSKGGGILRIYANQFIASSTVSFLAIGTIAGSVDCGGGAGGSIYLEIGQWNLTGTVALNVTGGAGDGTNGGDGGGGRVHVQVMDQVINAGTINKNTLAGSGTYSGGEQPGTCYADGITISGCP